jgi:hypothetical protein
LSVAERPPASATAPTPLWLSHHPPDRYERCARIGSRHVCRRCLFLYPLAFLTTAVALASWPGSLDPWLLLLAPLPAVVEWWLEHLRRVRYSAIRQVVLTVPLAVALGRGFARYLDDPLDPLFWVMVLGYGGSCLAVALWVFLDEHAA